MWPCQAVQPQPRVLSSSGRSDLLCQVDLGQQPCVHTAAHSLLPVSCKGCEIRWQWISLPQIGFVLQSRTDAGSEKDKLKHCPMLPVSVPVPGLSPGALLVGSVLPCGAGTDPGRVWPNPRQLHLGLPRGFKIMQMSSRQGHERAFWSGNRVSGPQC